MKTKNSAARDEDINGLQETVGVLVTLRLHAVNTHTHAYTIHQCLTAAVLSDWWNLYKWNNRHGHSRGRKMREWTYWYDKARVANAGVKKKLLLIY